MELTHMIVGLILWGISIDQEYHWMVGQIAFFLFAAGIQIGNTAASSYIVDSYPLQSMSIITFYAVFLNLSAFVNPVSGDRPLQRRRRCCKRANIHSSSSSLGKRPQAGRGHLRPKGSLSSLWGCPFLRYSRDMARRCGGCAHSRHGSTRNLTLESNNFETDKTWSE